jgi:hypothetical protein
MKPWCIPKARRLSISNINHQHRVENVHVLWCQSWRYKPYLARDKTTKVSPLVMLEENPFSNWTCISISKHAPNHPKEILSRFYGWNRGTMKYIAWDVRTGLTRAFLRVVVIFRSTRDKYRHFYTREVESGPDLIYVPQVVGLDMWQEGGPHGSFAKCS